MTSVCRNDKHTGTKQVCGMINMAPQNKQKHIKPFSSLDASKAPLIHTWLDLWFAVHRVFNRSKITCMYTQNFFFF